jgi:hypothetical protein
MALDPTCVATDLDHSPLYLSIYWICIDNLCFSCYNLPYRPYPGSRSTFARQFAQGKCANHSKRSEERAVIAQALGDFDGDKGIIRAMVRKVQWSWLAMREGSQ